MTWQVIFDLFENLFKGVGDFWNWFVTPLQIGALSIAPIAIFSISGIIAFIGVAVVLWVFK